MPTKTRVAWVDSARGFGILAVVVSHVISGHPVAKWMFTFHVPLFFFLSGFVFRAEKPFGEFFKGKCRGLLLPYVTLAIPMILCEGYLTTVRGNSIWPRVFYLAGQVAVQRRMWTLWYLACLFFLELGAWFLVRRVQKPAVLAAVGAVLGAIGVAYGTLGGPALPWNLDLCFSALPFFLGGYLLRGRGEQIQKFACSRKGVLAFFALGAVNLASGAPGILGKTAVLDLFSSQYGIAPLSFLAAFAGIGAVVVASCWIHWKPVTYLGQNSLVYFAWHQNPVMTAISVWFPKWGIPVSDFFSSAAMWGEKLLEVCTILLVLSMCSWLLNRRRLRWLLGKRG
ncbi:MAG: acyltransferase family protein [Candidatus Faecousia sp.]|nr:acyltransferase family protein [Candidatus Faecousia sp.]